MMIEEHFCLCIIKEKIYGPLFGDGQFFQVKRADIEMSESHLEIILQLAWFLDNGTDGGDF